VEHTPLIDLPDLAEVAPLADAEIAAYRESGHVLVRGVASPAEVAAYRPIITGAALRHSRETRPLEERDTYGKAFLQVGNLWRQDAAVRRFVLARRFGKMAADLMGVDGVRILHDQALFKEPGGGFTPWHQDQLYWPLDTDHTITLWMPLVDVPLEVGSMTFVSGSHKLDMRSLIVISDESEEVLQRHVLAHNLAQHTYGAMAAGDATWHAGWTMHRAPGNPTTLMREVMTIIYFADGTRLLKEVPPSMEGDLTLFPGVARGDVAAGELTPLAYKREG